MDENEIFEELAKFIQDKGITIDMLASFVEKMEDEEAEKENEKEPTKEDGEKVFGMKFVKPLGE